MAGRRFLLYVWNDRTQTGFHLHCVPNERTYWIDKISHEKEDHIDAHILYLATGFVVRLLPSKEGVQERKVTKRQEEILINCVSRALTDVSNMKGES